MTSHSGLKQDMRYEPAIFTGTHTIGMEHKLELFYAGYVLSMMQKHTPMYGMIINNALRPHKIKLDNCATMIVPLLKQLRALNNE